MLAHFVLIANRIQALPAQNAEMFAARLTGEAFPRWDFILTTPMTSKISQLNGQHLCGLIAPLEMDGQQGKPVPWLVLVNL